VLVLDGSASPWQVLMMRRPGGADFAPGAYVFPGGSVHAEDAAFGDEYRAAAMRELFEEMGVLLARHENGRFAQSSDGQRLRGLLSDGTGWVAALAQLGLTPALDRLAFLARWVTPEAVPRRFDTRFYVTTWPSGQTVHPQDGEVSDWCWTTPARALSEDGLTLVHATRRILESVAREPEVSGFIARLRREAETPAVMPRVVRRADGSFEVVDEQTV
jgi:8-oxo-dGTP pyrophosphatase MutT (NUDIX family)